ncbi:hypothetical protein AGMMS49983_19840 [Clostridia bacterium]|nr:hypothetical protein AGMMS49983_19840 [Clostridia bacterium]
MSLQEEITSRASKIFRESYQMSIGELINLYKDGEMDIHPEFQRVFRWSEYQKTKLIESIMLNIPIPSIFVSQNEDGVWDIIDGVQRLSTIFQFVGCFVDEHGEQLSSLVLQKTDYLPSFEGMRWDSDDEGMSFTKEQQLFFKRARMDIIIMKKESDPNTKYELFQRLNTGGSLLSDQEVRNCLMIMTNNTFYEFVVELDGITEYRNCLPISDRRVDEQYRMELVLRLLVANSINWENLKGYTDFSELLDKETIILCEKATDYAQIRARFTGTFSLLSNTMGEDSFKKFNGKKHLGPAMAASFQAIAFGIYSNLNAIQAINLPEPWIINRIQAMYMEDTFIKNTTPGVRSIPRYKDLSEFGAEYFKP